MSLLDRIRSILGSGSRERSEWVYVQCVHCGEKLRARIDTYNDLSVQYDDRGESTYFCRKVIIGSARCYRPIEVKLSFDGNRRLIDREIDGGRFITMEDYLNAD